VVGQIDEPDEEGPAHAGPADESDKPRKGRRRRRRGRRRGGEERAEGAETPQPRADATDPGAAARSSPGIERDEAPMGTGTPCGRAGSPRPPVVRRRSGPT
jgi:hypothetical protein